MGLVLQNEKNSYFLICLMLMMTSFIPQVISDEPVRGSTYYVGGNGPGNYTSIQGAIYDARYSTKCNRKSIFFLIKFHKNLSYLIGGREGEQLTV
jgi:hypothetical protein